MKIMRCWLASNRPTTYQQPLQEDTHENLSTVAMWASSPELRTIEATVSVEAGSRSVVTGAIRFLSGDFGFHLYTPHDRYAEFGFFGYEAEASP